CSFAPLETGCAARRSKEQRAAARASIALVVGLIRVAHDSADHLRLSEKSTVSCAAALYRLFGRQPINLRPFDQLDDLRSTLGRRRQPDAAGAGRAGLGQGAIERLPLLRQPRNCFLGAARLLAQRFELASALGSQAPDCATVAGGRPARPVALA